MVDCPGMSAASVCKTVGRIAMVLCTLAPVYIKFPEPTDIPDLIMNVLPLLVCQVVLVTWITCTDIISPGGNNTELNTSRKDHYAINIMVIWNHNLVFRNNICAWLGSVHDSRVFDNSMVCQLLEEGMYKGYQQGDSGYPCR